MHHRTIPPNVPFLASALAWGSTLLAVDAQDPPALLAHWLREPQAWERDAQGPVVSLGEAGAFDDTHIFAPAVALEDGDFRLWYCGSRGAVAARVFRLGLASSRDGRRFRRHAENPVIELPDAGQSILTPALLRRPDGTTLREDGKLRLWFSTADLTGGPGLHTLHEAASSDGVRWSPASAPQLEHVYAPSVLKDGKLYSMWFTDVSAEPWTIRRARSDDGRRWRVDPKPCMVPDQPWEKGRLFYPTVLKRGPVYLMWYGSYWSRRPSTTALGFAASLDGRTWHKHPRNPVFRPDPERPWESHYVTSQSVLTLPDGSLRMWYASRRKPPFVNKYFALNTALWNASKQPVPVPRKRKS